MSIQTQNLLRFLENGVYWFLEVEKWEDGERVIAVQYVET